MAPPGHSLHRCATELDLGPESAYGWLAANASRFGFVQRYSWEAWHYGYDRPPAPCSAAGNAVGAAAQGGGGDGALSGGAGLPAFVPARFRAPLLRAAAHWNVSAALLAAQLMAESNFDPYAGSPAGAQGIAQFMPATAAAYGLKDPYDPEEAIEAQAHLMSDLIHQFGSPQLALAAYNAGPAPVEACDCVPGYPETQAYVTRILALLGGAGALAVPSFEVRLVWPICGAMHIIWKTIYEIAGSRGRSRFVAWPSKAGASISRSRSAATRHAIIGSIPDFAPWMTPEWISKNRKQEGRRAARRSSTSTGGVRTNGW